MKNGFHMALNLPSRKFNGPGLNFLRSATYLR